MKSLFKRSIELPPSGTESFFLWGPRQCGKTTLLKRTYPAGHWIDLLNSDAYRRYFARPEMLRLELVATSFDASRQVIIDEIQKVPQLLNEVHWLIENRGLSFALCGSSARKVRRGAANLLGGRAARFELRGMSATELGSNFDLNKLLNTGYLPRIYTARQPARLLRSYVSDYLKEEIAAEGLVRNLPAFSNFLDAAALSDGSTVNYSNIARDCGVSNKTVKGYFDILEDTLLGRRLPAWRKRAKRRLAIAPKFYFFDVGVVNHLARRHRVDRGSMSFGQAFENWVCHELSCFVEYSGSLDQLSFWRLSTQQEVDFILGNMRLAVEAKASPRIHDGHLKGLRLLAGEYPGVNRRVVVCLEPRMWRTKDGIDILPAADFVRMLSSGELT